MGADENWKDPAPNCIGSGFGVLQCLEEGSGSTAGTRDGSQNHGEDGTLPGGTRNSGAAQASMGVGGGGGVG